MPINLIHTSCKNCVFAKYEEKTQTGCSMDMLQKYRDKDNEILEAYDEEKEFFIINNKRCICYREKKYFDNRLKINDHISRLRYMKKHMSLRYCLVINMNQFDVADIVQIEAMLSQVSVKPIITYLVRYPDLDDSYTYEALTKFIKNADIPDWQIKTVLDKDKDFYNVCDNIANINKNCRFICTLKKDYTNFNKIIDKAQEVVYEDLSSFLGIMNKNEDCIFLNRKMYQIAKGQGIDMFTKTDKYIII